MLAKKSLGAAPAAEAAYIEDVFSTWLFQGTSSGTSSNIVNGIDLSGEGGLVWMKNRSSAENHFLYDTVRGNTVYLSSNTTTANSSFTGITFNGDGFTQDMGFGAVNVASWSFRQAKKFFDVVTYTGTGSARTVSHNLGSVPGVIIIKRTSGIADWRVYHRSLGATKFLNLNATDAEGTGTGIFNDTAPTSTVFTVGDDTSTNGNGSTYVAYLFAHDAGGFGDAGSDSIIKCGSYTGTGSNGTVINLGWEPQWLLVKNADAAANWVLIDNMRGVTTGGVDTYLRPNTTNTDDSTYDLFDFHATGFEPRGAFGICNAANTYIYIAIRRGPMKTPESGTEVYSAITWTGNDTTGRTLAHGLSSPPDLSITQWRGGDQDNLVWDKLRGFSTTSSGNSVYLRTPQASVESSIGNYYYIPDMVNVAFGSVATGTSQLNSSNSTLVGWNFRRAPGFFDIVCYTGTGSARTVSHNLGVAPELMIVKSRTTTDPWPVYHVSTGNSGVSLLNSTSATGFDNEWNYTTPTSSVFSVGPGDKVNGSSQKYVAYLFASVSGVSKVGSYTGNGSSQTINCGFTAGARFVLIKRTDNTGDWVVFDSARGIVSGNDPYLELNTTDAEVTDKDAVDTDNTGFVVNETTGPNVNTNSATYIYLAIA